MWVMARAQETVEHYWISETIRDEVTIGRDSLMNVRDLVRV